MHFLNEQHEKTQIPVDMLREVYERGLCEWNENMGIEDHTFARIYVRSFCEGGHAFYENIDIAEKMISQIGDVSGGDGGLVYLAKKFNRWKDRKLKGRLYQKARNQYIEVVQKGKRKSKSALAASVARTYFLDIRDFIDYLKTNGDLIPEYMPEDLTLEEARIIDRAKMPQIPEEHYDEFFEYLKGHGVPSKKELINPNRLTPMQKISDEGVDSLISAQGKYAQKFKKPVLVSKDYEIIDRPSSLRRAQEIEQAHPHYQDRCDIRQNRTTGIRFRKD